MAEARTAREPMTKHTDSSRSTDSGVSGNAQTRATESREINWLTTAPNPRTPDTGWDAGQRGWKLHAVKAPKDAKLGDVKRFTALCGITPRHGWGMDLFIDEKCSRCSKKIERTA